MPFKIQKSLLFIINFNRIVNISYINRCYVRAVVNKLNSLLKIHQFGKFTIDVLIKFLYIKNHSNTSIFFLPKENRGDNFPPMRSTPEVLRLIQERKLFISEIHETSGTLEVGPSEFNALVAL